MQINVIGGKQYQKDYVRSMIEYCAKMLMSSRLANKLEITCHLDKNFIKKTGNTGECGWEDDNVRPKEFELTVDSSLKLRNLLTVVAHEMVHVKQFARGEMKDLLTVNKVSWQGKQYNNEDINYWDRPWEIEAHGRETGLFIRWAEKNNLGKKKWTHETL
jgi:hypothetical protein